MAYCPLSEPGVALHDRHREAFSDGFLLSTPHPALRATFPASRRRGGMAENAASVADRARWSAEIRVKRLHRDIAADILAGCGRPTILWLPRALRRGAGGWGGWS